MDFYYLSFPELSPDLHSVEVPSRVGAPVVVSYPDFLYYVADVFQLDKKKKRQHNVYRAAATALEDVQSKSTHLHNKHVLSSPLEVETSLSLVDTQVFLLSAHSLLAVQDYEHVSVRPRSEHITGVYLYLIRHNWVIEGEGDPALFVWQKMADIRGQFDTGEVKNHKQSKAPKWSFGN